MSFCFSIEVLKIFFEQISNKDSDFSILIWNYWKMLYYNSYSCIFFIKQNSKLKTKSHFCSTYELKDFSKISVNFFPTHVFSKIDMVSENPWNFTEPEILREIIIVV